MTALILTAQRLPDLVRRNWRLAIAIGTLVAMVAVALATAAVRNLSPQAELPAVATVQDRLHAAAAAMSATDIRSIPVNRALAINAAIPVANLANPAARPFRLTGSEADRARSLDCLTAAIYYEAAREPLDGQRAVAQVVLNRVRHPAYPNTVCGVVFEGARRTTGCQFSFTCDGSLRRAPMASFWERARQVAAAALAGYVYSPVGWATHYHANYVVPYWSSSLIKSANVGLHIFYRWRGGWGRPTAFVNRYAGTEPAIAWRGGFGQPLRSEVLTADARDAMAADAAREANPSASVDSFQRAVLRRYEPFRRDTATAQIAQRASADQNLTSSQRWSLTGEGSGPPQRPLGRAQPQAEQPPELRGVRYRWDPGPPATQAAPTPSGGGEASETAAH